MKTVPDHEKLFDEICGKLNELSQKPEYRGDIMASNWNERIEKMQMQLKKNQEDLLQSQNDLEEKLTSMDHLNVTQNDINLELKRVGEQLDQERQNNSKLSTDLARSLELNLKLQFEIEEIRSKANQVLNEEKKHNQYLSDKNKNISHELELSQALCHDTRIELSKALEKFQDDQKNWIGSKLNFENKIEELKVLIEDSQNEIDGLKAQVDQKESELNQVSDSFLQFESHAQQQAELLKNISAVAEKKIIELKMALDKKTAEAQDYYSHLQHALTQVSVLKQENSSLKDYITKLAALHQQNQMQQQKAIEVRA